MTAPSSTVVQINVKTPAGTLFNIYATNVAEAKEITEAVIEDLVNSVAALEQAFAAASTVASHAPVAPRQPVSAEAVAGPAAQDGNPAAQPGGGAPEGTHLCEHGEPMKFIPPGISKAGKPYKGFYACARDRASQCNKKIWT